MKKILTFFCLFCVITITLFGQARPHSDKAYVSNPEFAKQDALYYVKNGNISNNTSVTF